MVVCEPSPVCNTSIRQVSSYKYLDVFMDSSLTWHLHIDSLCTKLQQKRYFLRGQRLYGVSSRLLFLFYFLNDLRVWRVACKPGMVIGQFS